MRWVIAWEPLPNRPQGKWKISCQSVHSAHQVSSGGSRDGLTFVRTRGCGARFPTVCPRPVALAPSGSIILQAAQESRPTVCLLSESGPAAHSVSLLWAWTSSTQCASYPNTDVVSLLSVEFEHGLRLQAWGCSWDSCSAGPGKSSAKTLRAGAMSWLWSLRKKVVMQRIWVGLQVLPISRGKGVWHVEI